jgi:hypothetical protein
MTDDPARLQQARHILHRLGETGQPPERGALEVNVGTDHYLEALRQEYLVPMRETGFNSTFKLIQAPFGGGKTQFLHCLREIAWQEGFVTALVGVSPQECPFDDLPRIYQAVASHLELPATAWDEEHERGVDAVLRMAVERRLEESTPDELREWLGEECARARVESHAVRRATVLFMQALVDRHPEDAEVLGAFLRGDRVSEAELRAYRVREVLEPATAFRFLRSLVQVLRFLDFPGAVLLFDEMDRVMSLTVRRRRAIGDNLRQMIDYCGQSTLPGVLWGYAVPPEFLTSVVPEYPALEQRLRGAAHFAPQSPIAPIIDLDALPMGPTELLYRIGHRLIELYCEAWPEQNLDRQIARENIDALAHELGEQQLESGARRTFVRAAVQLLTAQTRDEQRRLTSEEIAVLAGTRPSAAPPPMGGEDIFE